MKRQGKRIVSAWLLLSILVSMILLTGLHRHLPAANQASDCVECAHHVHHSGHLTATAEQLDDCVLCQFLSLVYTPATTLLVAIPTCPTVQPVTDDLDMICCEAGQYDSTRAPPFIL